MTRLATAMLAGLLASGCSTGLGIHDTGNVDDDTGVTDTDTDVDTDADTGTDPDTGSDTDADTDADSDTDPGTGTPSGCTDDSFEDDDTFGDANSLGAPDSASGTVCSGDPDWFAVSAGGDCLVTFDLAFTQGSDAEDLDLTLFDDSEAVLDYSWSTDDDESITYITDAAQDLYLRVNGYDGAENDYDLTVSQSCWSTPLACPADDVFEPNDTIAAAASINLAPTSLDGAVCGDSDFYAIVGGEGCVLDAGLDIDDEGNDLDLWLHDSDEQIVGWSAGSSGDEALQFTFADDPVYYLEVAGWDGAQGAYTLDAVVDCLAEAPTCANGDDLYEDNDTQVTGAQLNPIDTVLEGAACDDDWYWVYVPEGCWFQGYLDFAHADGDLDLELLDSGGTYLDWSESESDGEYLSWIAPEAALVDVHAYGYDGATASYALSTSVTCPQTDAACPGDDIFEENDVPEDGAQLNRGFTWVEAALCGESSDYYWAIVPDGCTLDLDLEASDTSVDLDLFLSDLDGNGLGSSTGSDGVESMSHTASGLEIVDVEVWGYSDDTAYVLTSNITCP